MNVADLIIPERTLLGCKAASRKGALELLSKLITTGCSELSYSSVFDSFVARERLGGTGLGRGIALPHGRLQVLPEAIGAFVRLDNGVDFDASDWKPVDLLFALAVPANSTDEHLRILARLARMFRDPALCEQLRLADSNTALHDLLSDWHPHD